MYKAVDLEFGVFAAVVKPMVVLILNEKRTSNYSITIYNDNLIEKIRIPISEILSKAPSINTHISEKQKKF
ncbi:MAG: hypothetical protein IPH56_05195 [Chitinophagaceae bacterium]|nr:hypothetical protein [Chitinophagaceae bacterium]